VDVFVQRLRVQLHRGEADDYPQPRPGAPVQAPDHGSTSACGRATAASSPDDGPVPDAGPSSDMISGGPTADPRHAAASAPVRRMSGAGNAGSGAGTTP